MASALSTNSAAAVVASSLTSQLLADRQAFPTVCDSARSGKSCFANWSHYKSAVTFYEGRDGSSADLTPSEVPASLRTVFLEPRLTAKLSDAQKDKLKRRANALIVTNGIICVKSAVGGEYGRTEEKALIPRFEKSECLTKLCCFMTILHSMVTSDGKAQVQAHKRMFTQHFYTQQEGTGAGCVASIVEDYTADAMGSKPRIMQCIYEAYKEAQALLGDDITWFLDALLPSDFPQIVVSGVKMDMRRRAWLVPKDQMQTAMLTECSEYDFEATVADGGMDAASMAVTLNLRCSCASPPEEPPAGEEAEEKPALVEQQPKTLKAGCPYHAKMVLPLAQPCHFGLLLRVTDHNDACEPHDFEKCKHPEVLRELNRRATDTAPLAQKRGLMQRFADGVKKQHDAAIAEFKSGKHETGPTVTATGGHLFAGVNPGAAKRAPRSAFDLQGTALMKGSLQAGMNKAALATEAEVAEAVKSPSLMTKKQELACFHHLVKLQDAFDKLQEPSMKGIAKQKHQAKINTADKESWGRFSGRVLALACGVDPYRFSSFSFTIYDQDVTNEQRRLYATKGGGENSVFHAVELLQGMVAKGTASLVYNEEADSKGNAVITSYRAIWTTAEISQLQQKKPQLTFFASLDGTHGTLRHGEQLFTLVNSDPESYASIPTVYMIVLPEYGEADYLSDSIFELLKQAYLWTGKVPRSLLMDKSSAQWKGWHKFLLWLLRENKSAATKAQATLEEAASGFTPAESDLAEAYLRALSSNADKLPPLAELIPGKPLPSATIDDTQRARLAAIFNPAVVRIMTPQLLRGLAKVWRCRLGDALAAADKSDHAAAYEEAMLPLAPFERMMTTDTSNLVNVAMWQYALIKCRLCIFHVLVNLRERARSCLHGRGEKEVTQAIGMLNKLVYSFSDEQLEANWLSFSAAYKTGCPKLFEYVRDEWMTPRWKHLFGFSRRSFSRNLISTTGPSESFHFVLKYVCNSNTSIPNLIDVLTGIPSDLKANASAERIPISESRLQTRDLRLKSGKEAGVPKQVKLLRPPLFSLANHVSKVSNAGPSLAGNAAPAWGSLLSTFHG